MDDTEFLLKLGAKIRTIRKAKKISQIQLAANCNFDKASMSRLEAGHTNPTLRTLQKISNSLEVQLSEFFKE